MSMDISRVIVHLPVTVGAALLFGYFLVIFPSALGFQVLPSSEYSDL